MQLISGLRTRLKPAIDWLTRFRRQNPDVLQVPLLIFVCAHFLFPIARIEKLYFYFAILLPLLLILKPNHIRQFAGSRVFVTAFFLLCYLFVSVLWSSPPDLPESVKTLKNLIALSGFLLLTAWLAAESADFSIRLYKSICSAAAIGALISMAGFTFYPLIPLCPPLDGRLTFYGCESQPIIGASAYGMAMVAGYIGLSTGKLKSLLLHAGILTIGVAIVLSQSRGPIFTLYLTFLISAWCLGQKRIGALLMLLPITIFLLQVFLPIIPHEMIARGSSYRFEIWQGVIRGLEGHRFFGMGLLSPSLVQSPITGEWFKHAHSAFFATAWYGGIIGLGIFLVLMATALAVTWRYRNTPTGFPAFILLIHSIGSMLTDTDRILTAPGAVWIYLWLPLALAVSTELTAIVSRDPETKEHTVNTGYPQRIALYVASLGTGGIGRWAVNLTRELTARGYRVDLVTGPKPSPYVKQVDEKVRMIRLPTTHPISTLLFWWIYLVIFRPHTLITDRSRTNRTALMARHISPGHLQIITVVHNHVSSRLNRFHEKRREREITRLRRMLSITDAVVCVSAGVKTDLTELLTPVKAPLHLLQNPVLPPDLHRLALKPVPHPWLDPSSPIPVIMAMGRMNPQKDFTTLLSAFAIVRKTECARLIILGDGADRSLLETLAAQTGCSEDIAFPGHVINPYAWLSRARLFVLSSRWEGFGYALVEAMALGVACVSTDCPSGPREILENGRLGCLVPVEDAQALADAITRTLGFTPDPDALSRSAEVYRSGPVADQYLTLAGLPAAAPDPLNVTSKNYSNERQADATVP